MKYFLVLFLLATLSCSTKEEQHISSINELHKVDFTNGENMLVDVRTPEEFAEGHIENAINLDVNDSNFDSKISKLDTAKTYYIYCQAGTRSSKATSKLLRQGFKNIVNLKDGYKAYTPK